MTPLKDKTKMDAKKYILDFERPLFQLSEQIGELEATTYDDECQSHISTLKQQLEELRVKVYSSLSPAQKLQIARHPMRPYTLDYVQKLGTNWVELQGDREGNNDHAIVGGLLTLPNDMTVMVVGTEKGRGIKDKQKRNFGMPQPWGYRKALRLFKHAESFGIPILTLVDTPGAYPGLEAESQGQSRAIAKNIQEMSGLSVPIVSLITGEGGSGGALALAVADHVMMLEYSVYSVISPEGCAAILWRSREYASQAAEKLRITAPELRELGLIDQVISEPLGGAHNNLDMVAQNLQEILISKFADLQKLSQKKLINQRRKKYRNYGFFTQ